MSEIVLGEFAPSGDGFLDDNAVHSLKDRQRLVGKVGARRIEGMEPPALAAPGQLAEGPLPSVLRQHEGAVLQGAVGLDDDDVALVEFGCHVVAEHAQRERFAAAAAGVLVQVRCLGRCAASTAHSMTSAWTCAAGTPAWASSAHSVSTKTWGPAM